jgi:hypothetical protein
MTADEVLIRRAEIVRIHLAILDALLKEPPSVSQAIRASISLRFLLGGPLNRVAHDKSMTLRVPTPDLSGVPIGEALVFACGGYTLGDNEIAPYYAFRQPVPSSPYQQQFERQARDSPSRHTLVNMKVGTFQQQPCLGIMCTTFTREAVVHYVANKCGGAHHHDDTAAFQAIEHGLTTVGHVLEVDGLGLSVVFLETLGTAWFLLNAPDIVTLRSILGD